MVDTEVTEQEPLVGPLGLVRPSSWEPPGSQAQAQPLSYASLPSRPPPMAAEEDEPYDPASEEDGKPRRKPEPFAEYQGWVRELWLHGWNDGPFEEGEDPAEAAHDSGVRADGAKDAAARRRASREQAASQLLRRMAALAGGGRALDLRQARLLAWFRAQDLSLLGYPGFPIFMRERLDWKSSWTYQLMKLSSCGLPRIQAAVCLGLISFEQAFQAVGEIGPDEQVDWLDRALAGLVEAWREKRPRPSEDEEPLRWSTDLQGEQLQEILRARHMARLCMGRPVSDEQADRYILIQWRKRRPGKEILAEARQPPPVPDVGESSWCDAPDPATPLVGPWIEPRDLQHGLRLLENLQQVRRLRVLALGRAYQLASEDRLYLEMGYHSLGGLAQDGLDTSTRTLERYRALAQLIDELLPVHQAVEQGLDLSRARMVADMACEEDVEDWLHVAKWTGVGELRRAVKLVGSSKRVARELLAMYRQAIAAARELVPGAEPMGLAPAEEEASPAQEEDATESGDQPRSGQDAKSTASRAQADATRSGNRPRALKLAVALRAVLAPPPAPRWVTVHADLPAAARWFLENVKPEPQKGFGKVKERDDFRCQNPECRRRTLRAHAHHHHERNKGGGNQLWNGKTVDPSCHLRLIHAGRVTVEEIKLEGLPQVVHGARPIRWWLPSDEGRALELWRYPGRVVVVF